MTAVRVLIADDQALVRAGFANAGQLCTSVERIYVHRAVAEPFLAALTARAQAFELGPRVDDDQRDRVHNHVEDACRNGATYSGPR